MKLANLQTSISLHEHSIVQRPVFADPILYIDTKSISFKNLLNLFFKNKSKIMTRIVTGNLIYKTAYDYAPNEQVTIKFLGKSFPIGIDEINNDFVESMLLSLGIKKANIIATGGYGSSAQDVVEIFFAYEGTLPQRTVDLWIVNKHHSYASYAVNDGLIVPAYMYIKPGLEAAINKIVNNYEILSFLVKPFVLPNVPVAILTKSPTNGILADMRNIPMSYQHVIPFKKLNWERLWYMDAGGRQKMEVRPKTGWVI